MDLYALDRLLVGGTPAKLYAGGTELWPAGKPAGRPVFATFAGMTTVPTTARTGQVLGQFSGPGEMAGGGFDSPEGTGATYLECNTGRAAVTTIGASFRFDTVGGTRAGDGCTLCCVSWADGGIVANGFGRRTSAHVTVTPNAVQWYVRDVLGTNITVTNIGTRTLNPPLAKNQTHRMEVQVDHATNTGTVRLGDGRTFTWTDPRIVQYPGEVFACWEPFYNADGTDSRVRVERIWADGPALPPEPVTPLFIDGGTTVNEAASTTGTLTIPTVRAGDILVLGAVMAQNGTAMTLSGPAFTERSAQNRSGLGSRLWTRTAQASDSGQTIGIAFGNNLPSVTSLVIVRNVAGHGNVTGNNLGSGTSTITPPAFTPAAGVLPVHLVALARSSPAAATPSPPTNMTRIGGADPTSGRVTGLAWAYNPTAGQSIGTTWTNPQGHIQAAYLIPITV